MFNRSQVKDVFDRSVEDDDANASAAEAGAESGCETTEFTAAGSTEDDKDRVRDTATDDEEADGSDSVDKPSSSPRAKRSLRRTVVAVVCGVVAVALLGSVGYLGWQLKQLEDTAAASWTALAAARSYALALTSVDSKDVDGNFARVLDGATGEFKDMYSRSSAQLRQLLIDNKAEAKGTVVDAAVKSATKTKVEVLLFIDQSVTNSVNPAPRIDRSRVAMTMELIDKRWLASKVDVT